MLISTEESVMANFDFLSREDDIEDEDEVIFVFRSIYLLYLSIFHLNKKNHWFHVSQKKLCLINVKEFFENRFGQKSGYLSDI